MTGPGCPFGAGPKCWDCDGSCWHIQAEPPRPEPTVEEICAAANHAYYGDEGPRTGGRCYCGERSYPAGGPA